jgi:hypothetical protein
MNSRLPAPESSSPQPPGKIPDSNYVHGRHLLVSATEAHASLAATHAFELKTDQHFWQATEKRRVRGWESTSANDKQLPDCYNVICRKSKVDDNLEVIVGGGKYLESKLLWLNMHQYVRHDD